MSGKKKLNTNNIATSGRFDKTSYHLVLDKIKYLNLKNIKLIKGDFVNTVPAFFKNRKIKIKSRTRKTREELSVSASKSIKKENIEIVVSFK